MLDYVTVTRYVTPLREGGSLPAIVEADNLGTYVMKFRGAGQGPLALVAEIIWPTADPKRPFDAAEHVLRDRAAALGAAHAALAPRITEDLLAEVTALVPPGWFGDRDADAYVEHLLQRAPVVPEVIRP